MAMNKVQFQRGLSMLEFFDRYGIATSLRCSTCSTADSICGPSSRDWFGPLAIRNRIGWRSCRRLNMLDSQVAS